MAKYRKKPVVIEASQWFKNGDHPKDYTKSRTGFECGGLTTFSGDHCRENGWEGGLVRYFRHPGINGTSVCQECDLVYHLHGWIDTLEGGHRVCPGDWIITGTKGEHYPCKPDIFDEIYEMVT